MPTESRERPAPQALRGHKDRPESQALRVRKVQRVRKDRQALPGLTELQAPQVPQDLAETLDPRVRRV